MITTPRRPSGFNEYLPAQQIEFNRLLDIIRSTYEKYGFAPIDTPDIELSEVLLAKSGGETETQIYRFERGKNDLSLRFDLTVPLARYAAEHENELVFPFRRYHIGKVHRAERAQAGRFREFYQCDIDVIGSNSSVIDAEFPAIINEIFSKFSFGEFVVRINNRMVLNGFFESLFISADMSADVLRIIDKIDKISETEYLIELGKLGLSTDQIDKIVQFTAINGSNNDILDKLKALNVASSQYIDGVSKLRELVIALRDMGVPEKRFAIDLHIARGLAYYTGTVYETVLSDYPELGSVCSGGRYDNLAGNYTKTSLPGVGISIGLSRLFYKLSEIGIIKPSAQSPASLVVMPLDTSQHSFAINLANDLRNAGVNTVLYTEKDKVRKKLQFADRMGFEWVVIIGDKEVAESVVSLKNMNSGQSIEIARNEIIQHIQTA